MQFFAMSHIPLLHLCVMLHIAFHSDYQIPLASEFGLQHEPYNLSRPGHILPIFMEIYIA